MSVRVTFLGHGAFRFDSHGRTVLVDPFLTGNPAASCRAADLRPDAVVVSHGHGDHVGDTVEIARRTGCLVIANHEICEWFRGQGLENLHAQHVGGAHAHPFGTVKLTIAHHGSMLPDGSNGGNPCGVLLSFPDATIYHACDTGLFLDMQLVGEAGLDLAILPIGDNYTMGPDDALRAVKLLRPRQVVPDHYDTFPVIAQDAHAWAARVRAETGAVPVVLRPGESLDVGRAGL
jgi:L-ascorbate metabolism protein UlaG (beta-lactamase superfamily)